MKEKSRVKKYLIVGLGNPGKEYEKTRHNFGFEALNRFIFWFNGSTNADFPVEFHNEAKFFACFCMVNSGDKKIFLIKPQTFMNLSGRSVKRTIDYYKINLENLIVVHDDLDLSFGKIRFSKNSSSAGHKGVKSIIEFLGSQNFVRLRLGIKDGDSNKNIKKPAEKFVLENFSSGKNKIKNEIFKQTTKALNFFLEKGFEEAANTFN